MKSRGSRVKGNPYFLLNVIFIILFPTFSVLTFATASWDEWWTYDGISGPDFWGLLNPDWKLCNQGKRQSPVDIKPGSLLYDPFLRPLMIDKHRVNGVLENNGHSIVFQVNHNREGGGLVSRDLESSMSSNDIPQGRGYSHINISGGPLSYSYTFDSVHIHFGRTDSVGSEHLVAGLTFPAELQIIGYNSDLYQNISEASKKANGLVSVALLIQLGNSSNMELRHLTSLSHHIKFRGQNITVNSLSIRELIPDLDYFMTYEGSMTIPGCYETVTWVVINKPIIITRTQLYSLRKLMQGEADLPKAPLGNNFRPIQSLNHRLVRTNIDFKRKQGAECPTMKKKLYYQVNSKHFRP